MSQFVLASSRRVVFIPFHHRFLEKKTRSGHDLPICFRFSSIYASYDLYRIGISWIRMMDVDEFQYCCGTNGLSWGILWGEGVWISLLPTCSGLGWMMMGKISGNLNKTWLAYQRLNSLQYRLIDKLRSQNQRHLHSEPPQYSHVLTLTFKSRLKRVQY